MGSYCHETLAAEAHDVAILLTGGSTADLNYDERFYTSTAEMRAAVSHLQQLTVPELVELMTSFAETESGRTSRRIGVRAFVLNEWQARIDLTKAHDPEGSLNMLVEMDQLAPHREQTDAGRLVRQPSHNPKPEAFEIPQKVHCPPVMAGNMAQEMGKYPLMPHTGLPPSAWAGTSDLEFCGWAAPGTIGNVHMGVKPEPFGHSFASTGDARLMPPHGHVLHGARGRRCASPSLTPTARASPCASCSTAAYACRGDGATAESLRQLTGANVRLHDASGTIPAMGGLLPSSPSGPFHA